jgi:hypothetical protein
MKDQGQTDRQLGREKQRVAVQVEPDVAVGPEFEAQQILDIATIDVDLGDQIVGRRQRTDAVIDAVPDLRLVVQYLMQNGVNRRCLVLEPVLQLVDDQLAVFLLLDQAFCDLPLLRFELGPYGHVRFNLNGDPLFLPAKLAVSLALIFHELATNAGKYGAFSAARGLLQVTWLVSGDRLNIIWDETEGPTIESVGEAGFGTKLLKSALRSFDGKTEISFLKTGVHCTMQCRIPAS